METTRPEGTCSRIDPATADTARHCRQYAMCKIDFLGTGLCPAVGAHPFVSFYPQGRMLLYEALADGRLPFTDTLVEIARSCTGCDRCDRQCYFVTELRPRAVALALRAWVEEECTLRDPLPSPRDPLLAALEAIVGPGNASMDPSILVCYASDPCPVSPLLLPRAVVLPGSAAEVSRVVALCRENSIPFAVRGNGSSVMGFVLTNGLVLDMNRMKGLRIDRENWCVHVEAGVTAFELQQAAAAAGVHANTAEPAASVCANLMCSGLFSLFSHAYGTAADNLIDAEFVGLDGRLFTLSQREAPNLYAFLPGDQPVPGICTRASIRLHPACEGETGIAVPFADFEEAFAYTRELGRRRIGIGAGLIGVEYLATFLAPTAQLAIRARHAFSEILGLKYLVIVLGDPASIQAAQSLTRVSIDQDLMRTLILGLPRLVDESWLSILARLEGDRPIYEMITESDLSPLLKAALQPSPKTFAAAVTPDLRAFFTDLYSRPEMTDLVWLNLFRIISSRMGREGHVVAIIVYIPMDDANAVTELIEILHSLSRAHEVRGDFGFITPLDLGRRAVLEFDFYLDHTCEEEKRRMAGAMQAAGAALESFPSRHPGFLWIKTVFNQGFCRKEGFLYPGGRLTSDHE